MSDCRKRWIMLPVLALLLAACGAAPRVRVTPTHGLPAGADAATTAAADQASPRTTGSSVPTYRVVAGETLYSIAFRQGRDYRELAAINQIREPFTIYPGQLLKLQSAASSTPAPAINQPAPTSPASSPVAATGTFALAEPERPLTAQTLPESPSAVQDVQLSEQGRLLRDPPQAAPTLAAPAPAAALPAGSEAVVATLKPTVAAAAPIDDQAPARTIEGVRWRWPASGKLIGRFLAGDPTQQGIDLAGQVGAPVLAAADGEVVYSGNGLLGYGELLIVQHSPDFLSAYGHNQRRLVQEGERVRAGQMIAEQGQRGSISLLHFEVRRRGKPVDPLSYLPPR